MAPVPSSTINVGHIDDVQELRQTKTSSIPHRFIRNSTERPTPAHDAAALCDTVPVIDLSKLAAGNESEFCNEISKLSAACEEWGFFQVINHGVDKNLLESIETVAMEFFMLPLEEKQKYPMAPGTVQGYGQAFVFSENQKLDWCNMFALALEPHSSRNLKLWPAKPALFSGTVEIYAREIRKFCKIMMKNIAASLRLNGEAFEDIFGEAVQAVRMNYYPTCPKPDVVFGLSPHSDGSAITVLQERKSSSVGLQILKNGTWVPVQPLPDALVINIGDTIEVLTNGKYKSVEHRAVAHKEKDRLSIVTFYAPSYDMEIGPIQELVNENNPCKFRRYNHGDYSKHYTSNKLQGKKRIEFAKLEVVQTSSS